MCGPSFVARELPYRCNSFGAKEDMQEPRDWFPSDGPHRAER